MLQQAETQTKLALLEVTRKAIVANQYKGWGLIVLGIIVIISLTSAIGPITSIILSLVSVVPGGVILSRTNDKTAEYKTQYKQEIVSLALNEVNSSLILSPHEGISLNEFNSSELFSTRPDRYHTEDLVRGIVDKTAFYFAEVHAEYKTEVQTKHGRKTIWHDIIKGMVFAADFNKHFNGITLVRPKDFSSSFSAWFSKNIYAFGNNNVVELESDYFKRNFLVYANDQVEARYILTPALMERIENLNNRAAYTISLSFINSSMYIAFPLAKNYFEAPIYKTLLKPDLLDDDINVLKFMYEIVHELDLNTRIWTKQ